MLQAIQLTGTAILLALAANGSSSLAEPIDKQVSIIVAGTAGGGIDLYARIAC